MKKISLLLCCMLFTGVIAYAQLNVVVQDGNLTIDTTGFPPKMKTAYSLMINKCNQCHSLERIIVGVQSGICPLTKSEFNRESITAIVTRMFRKDNSNISREDAREILQLLEFLLNKKTTVVKQIAGKTDPVLPNMSSSRNVERNGSGNVERKNQGKPTF